MEPTGSGDSASSGDDNPPPSPPKTWRQRREEVAERRWMRREETKAERARRAQMKQQRRQENDEIVARRTAERLARDVNKLFTAAEALSIGASVADSTQTQELKGAEAQAAAPEGDILAVEPIQEETCAEPHEEEIHEQSEPVDVVVEESPSSPMLADSEIAAEGELPPSPAPQAEEPTEELPPCVPAPVEEAAAAPPTDDEDQTSKFSWPEPMETIKGKEEVEQPEPEDELRKKALQTMPRWARGEAAERDATSQVFESMEPLHCPVPPVLVLPQVTAEKLTFVAEAITFRMPQVEENTRAWYRPDLFIKSSEQGTIPKIVRRPRTIYHRDETEMPAVRAAPAVEPMEVDEPTPAAAVPENVPRDITESDWDDDVSPVQTRAEEETVRKTLEKAADSTAVRDAVKVTPIQRGSTPLPVMPIDTAPIAQTPTRWDEPGVSRYAGMNLAPYSRTQEQQEYAAYHPSKAGIKKARKNRENPNPRRNLTKEDYFSRHLSPEPSTSKATAFSWPARTAEGPMTAPQPSASSWPAPAADWTTRSHAPEGNWRERPTTTQGDLRGWLNKQGYRAGARNEKRSQGDSERRPRVDDRHQEPIGEPLTGVCRTITTGTMYDNIRAIVTDPRVDPPRLACFNCWEQGHTYVKCPRPQTQHYCRNCGRRHVEVQQCPRCSEAHRAHLDHQRRQYQEHLMRIGRETMQRQRAELYGQAWGTQSESGWNQFERSRSSQSNARDRAMSESPDHQRQSRKRTREASQYERHPRGTSRGSSARSSPHRREEPRTQGARHETLRILEETRRMNDRVREGLMRSIVHEFEEEEELRKRRRH